MKLSKHKPAFTLIEMLIAVSIFSIVAVVTSMIFVDSLRLDRKTTLQQQVFIDARFVLDQIATAVSINAIDYNEYYNQTVKAVEATKSEFGNFYGANHGAYTAQFYNPGQGGDIGTFCNDAARTRWTPGSNCTILTRTVDHDTGQNPYARDVAIPAAEPKRSNAVCFGVKADGTPQTVGSRCRADVDAPCDPDDPCATENIFPELFLISPDGMTKIMYVREAIAPNTYAISYVKMNGLDTNGDQIPDVFTCDVSLGFSCTGNNAGDCGAANILCPKQSDKGEGDLVLTEPARLFADDFVPISPNRINIQQLTFTISPLEDALRAFDEPDRDTQKLPHVTITMTVVPNSAVVGSTAGTFQPLTLQETVTTTILEPVPTPIFGQYE